MNSTLNLKVFILISLFAAMTAIGAFIAIPIPFSPVPVVLQNFFIIFMGLVLPPSMSAASVGLYLFLGAVGFPIFAGGTGGIAHFISPSAGYLVAYFPAAVIGSIITKIHYEGKVNHNITEKSAVKINKTLLIDLLSVTVMIIVIYIGGILWLKYRLNITWAKSILVGVTPFIPGCIVKCTAAIILAPKIRNFLKQEGFLVSN